MKLMKKLSRLLCAGLLVLSVAATSSMLTGCTTTQTATEQISSQTDNPAIIARAAYLDALKLYNDLAEKYAYRYQKYVLLRHPDINDEVIKTLADMTELLKTWEAYSAVGVTPDGSQDTFDAYVNMIIQIMLEVDAKLESE